MGDLDESRPVRRTGDAARPDRGPDLQLRVSVPVGDDPVPVLLFAHGFGSSLRAYGPLTDHWAANGFAVIQPTFLDSRTVGLARTTRAGRSCGATGSGT